MPINYEIQIKSDDIERLINKVNNITFIPMLEEMGSYQKESVLLNFEYQGRPKKWAPLSENYRKWKLSHGYTDRILILHGRLRQSINKKVYTDMVKIYSGVKYGVYHQTGTRKMPQRPFLVVQKDDVKVLTKIANNYIEKLLRG